MKIALAYREACPSLGLQVLWWIEVGISYELNQVWFEKLQQSIFVVTIHSVARQIYYDVRKWKVWLTWTKGCRDVLGMRLKTLWNSPKFQKTKIISSHLRLKETDFTTRGCWVFGVVRHQGSKCPSCVGNNRRRDIFWSWNVRFCLGRCVFAVRSGWWLFFLLEETTVFHKKGHATRKMKKKHLETKLKSCK